MPILANKGKPPARPASRELVVGTLVVAALALGLAGTVLVISSSSAAYGGDHVLTTGAAVWYGVVKGSSSAFVINIKGPRSTPGPDPAISALKVTCRPARSRPPWAACAHGPSAYPACLACMTDPSVERLATGQMRRRLQPGHGEVLRARRVLDPSIPDEDGHVSGRHDGKP
jgi:hypothetical protein